MSRRAAANLLIQLDPAARVSLQEQIGAGLRRAIVSGVMRPGTRIAPSRVLAAELRVSRMTVQLALDQLRAEGYVTARRGSGTFVADPLPDPPEVWPAPAPPAGGPRPGLSRRGAALASGSPAARRIPGRPRAFRLGVPALDRFPVALWSQLTSRRALSVSAAQLDYGSPAGLPALREAIAEHVRGARGARCEADQVVVVGSAQRGLDLLGRMLLDPGDRAVVEDPGYPLARGALVSAGAEVAPVPVDRDGLDPAACARLAAGARLAYVTPSHQFPLGMPMPLPRRLALLAWASAAGAWIVEDDYDAEFRHGARPVPCLQGLDADGRVIYVGSFSKSLFPSLRLGFLIAPPALAERLVAARRAGADPQPPFLDQAVTADFIAGGHFARHLRRMRAIYRERLEALRDGAARHAGGALRLRPVVSGLHAVADLDGAPAARVSEEARARGVEVMPLSAYASAARAPEALLFGFGSVPPPQIEDGMRALAAAIEAAGRPLAARLAAGGPSSPP
jgi:GntR family transcriptional regulator/MocR family aminotransferase